MASLNKVMLIGNLGRDPEVRYAPNGDPVATLAIATSFKSKDQHTGEQKQYTEWHRVSLFGRLAEVASQYLKKGGSVYIEGRLRTRKYTDKDGVERYTTDIIGERLEMLGRPADNEPAPPPATRPARPARPSPQPVRDFTQDDDDIPF